MDAHVDMWLVPTIPLTHRVANIYRHLQYQGGIQSLTWDFGFGKKNGCKGAKQTYLWLLPIYSWGSWESSLTTKGNVHKMAASHRPQRICSASTLVFCRSCRMLGWPLELSRCPWWESFCKDMHQRTIESIENTWGIKRKPHVEKTKHHHAHFQPKKNINLPTTTNQQKRVKFQKKQHHIIHCHHQYTSFPSSKFRWWVLSASSSWRPKSPGHHPSPPPPRRPPPPGPARRRRGAAAAPPWPRGSRRGRRGARWRRGGRHPAGEDRRWTKWSPTRSNTWHLGWI